MSAVSQGPREGTVGHRTDNGRCQEHFGLCLSNESVELRESFRLFPRRSYMGIAAAPC